MLPGAPLDGGRVLRAALWRRFRDRGRAGLAAARAGSVLRTVIAFTGVRGLLALGSLDDLWLVIIGVFIANAADSEAHTVPAVNALAGLLVSDVMTPDTGIAPAAFTSPPSPLSPRTAARTCSWSRIAGRPAGARAEDDWSCSARRGSAGWSVRAVAGPQPPPSHSAGAEAAAAADALAARCRQAMTSLSDT
jgi:hypothetical protein